MESVVTYNQEEVQELFDVVFKLSAKDIDDKLRKIANRPDIARRRWFWELLQNAKDAVKPNEKVSVKLIVGFETGQYYVEFLHNGNPFRYQDAKNLIFPYSDKADEIESDKSGRFGTGFMATHILAKQIEVKGIYVKGDGAFDFNFTLDRTGIDKPKIAESIGSTWQEFRNKSVERPDYIYSQTNFETSFRYSLDVHALQVVSNSIVDFESSLPYALVFIPKIETVQIDNLIEKTKTIYRIKETKTLTNNICEFLIERKTINTTGTTEEILTLLVCSDTIIDIAIEIYNQNEKVLVRKFLDHQPLLFCPFPLIGAKDFQFPTVVNSSSFTPKEERDGIWLDSAGNGLTNQKLFERVVLLYSDLVNYVSSQNWGNTYLLFKSLNKSLSIADLDAKWFKEKIQNPLKANILQVALVDIPNGQRLSAKSIFFQNEAKQENRMELWGFMRDIFPNNVSNKEEIDNWYEVIFEECPKFSIITFTKHIATFKTIDSLQNILNISKEATLKWLNNYVTFLGKTEPSLLNGSDSQILPNQFGVFKRKDELYLDDDTIDEPIKDILALISKFTKKVYDWRSDMLDKKIYMELPSNRVRNITLIGTTITEITKELLRENDPSNELRDLFSQLLNWLSHNPDKAKDFFKGLKIDTLLYKCADEKKMGKFTEMFKLDRDGEMNVDAQLAILRDPRIHLLSDPQLEEKIKLGEQVLADLQREKEEFQLKKKMGDVFEALFSKLVSKNSSLEIVKVEGEEDFVITNKDSGNRFYIELKSVRSSENQILMTHKQAKKASQFPNSYFLCIIPDNGTTIDENYFKVNARFDGLIGNKLSSKVKAALHFETPEPNIKVEFEDGFLKSYNKYRYKFSIQHTLWGQDDFSHFIAQLK